MSFVFPALLGGLLLVGIPILLHLILQQRPKRLPFPAFRFLVQRHRTNQRKLRLRHLLLLTCRVLLIALPLLALARPKLMTGRFNLGDRPAAVLLLFDTSPSMEYIVGGSSRLDEARRRALEMLDDLPEGSRVAILDTGEPGGDWLTSLSVARERVATLSIRPASGPLTSRLPEAFRLLDELGRDPEVAELNLPRFLCVFSDRTQNSWDETRNAELIDLRERVEGEFRSAFVDVGVESPSDLALVNLELPRQVIAAEDRLILRATVQATGADFDTEVVCQIDGESAPDRKPVKLHEGQSQVVTFERQGLKAGPHQITITLAGDDALPFNNVRYASCEVRGSRRVLVLTDEPREAQIWKLALTATGGFSVDVRRPAEARVFTPPELLRNYQAICLLNVAEPDRDLWERLQNFVHEGGGVAILPGGEELKRDAYNEDALARKLLPGKLMALANTPEREGVEWMWTNATYQHPMMKGFRTWNDNPDTDFVRFPRKAWRFWAVEPHPEQSSIIIRYADSEQHPAILEGVYNQEKVRGRLLLFTTSFDAREPRWNNYLEAITSFYPVLAQLAMRYLTGDAEEADFSHLCGQLVSVRLPTEPRYPTYTLDGPGLSPNESIVIRPENRADVLLRQAIMPGNYTLYAGDSKERVAWFSLNVAAAESQLGRVAAEVLEAVLGSDVLVPIGHGVSLREAMQGQWGQPVDLLPWLLILVLLVLAGENWLANRFYRQEIAKN